MTTNNAVNVGLSGSTGTGNFVGANTPTLITPNIGAATYSGLIPASNGNALTDAQNANALALLQSGGTSVNYITITNSATTNPVVISAVGSDTNVVLELTGKGNGGVAEQGSTTGTSPASGYKGEVITGTLANATMSTTATPQNVATISLTAGNWNLYCNPFILGGATNTDNSLSLSTTSATMNGSRGNTYYAEWSSSIQTFITLPLFLALSVSTTTTVYLVGEATFTGTGPTMYGQIVAVRR